MIRFVTALTSEAKPLINHYRLKARDGAYRWYQSEAGAEGLSLVVSGVGKCAAAAATAYLHARTGETPNAVWLNVGIAGHGTRPPGDVALAHTVSDRATRERWYPPRLTRLRPGPATAEVLTVDEAETRFETDALYDMEAAGFYRTALRFATSELVQVLKVVSDNRDRSFFRLTPENVAALVESGIDSVESTIAQLDELRAELKRSAPEELSELTQRWRFTTSEERKLARLLVRWQALEPDRPRASDVFDVANGSELIDSLSERVRRIARERPV